MRLPSIYSIPLCEATDIAAKIIEPILSEFDTIVVRGLSGIIPGTLLADRFGKQLCVVRKPDERHHTGARMEGRVGEKYIILDDFVASGDTLLAILQATNYKLPVYVVLYNTILEWWDVGTEHRVEAIPGSVGLYRMRLTTGL
jgi:orotate phosphoribosyltransferase-like protein